MSNEKEIHHVLPVDDIIQHEEEKYCNCNPKVEVYENGSVVIHNSFDMPQKN